MRRPFFFTLLCVAIALLTWAFSTRAKEGILMVFLGAAILLCTLVVGGLRHAGATLSKRNTPPTNISAILGALVGLFLGGFVGARLEFGRVMISIFNSDLSERDFGTSFGTIGGGLLGAFFLGLLSGRLQMSIVGSAKAVPVEDSKDSRSRGDSA